MASSNERLNRMLEGILDAIESGEDAQPLISRLHHAQPWLLAMMGNEYADQAIERVNQADERIDNG